MVAEAGHVHGPHVEAGIPRRDPVGHRQAHAAALRQPGHHPAGRPIPPQAPDRADQRVAVGGERERPVHHPLDPRGSERREVSEGHLQRLRDAVQVRRKQPHREVPRRLSGRPRQAGLLVGAEQHALALLAHVDLAAEVDHVHQPRAGAPVVLPHGFERLGDQVGVLHGQHRQLQAHHAPHLAGPQAPAVDDVLAVDRSEVLSAGGVVHQHPPAPVTVALDGAGPGVAVHLGAGGPGRLGVGVGHPGRIHMALVGIHQRPYEVLGIEQRHQLGRLCHRHQLRLHPQVAAPGVGRLEPVEPLGGVGQHHAAGHVDAAVLAGDPLDLGVQLGGVALQAGHDGVAVESVHAACAVPGRPRGELGALHQHHVGPAGLGEVVEHAGAHHSPADHHHPRLSLHRQRSVGPQP